MSTYAYVYPKATVKEGVQVVWDSTFIMLSRKFKNDFIFIMLYSVDNYPTLHTK